MSFRTVVIKSRCKLDYKMGYMVIRGEDTKRIFLDEIAVLLIESTAVSLTAYLLCALTEKKIKVIFCDNKRNPYFETAPLYGSHDSSQKIRTQIAWNDEIKGLVWTEIVAEKIRKQAEFLFRLQKFEQSALLADYITQLEFNDSSNREGHAAKVYFNAIFGKEFTRTNDADIRNAALNYGYSLILSAVNREVSANGYLTQLGIFHNNIFNKYNLSCDLMEPLRIPVDIFVEANEFTVFESDEKHNMLSILNSNVVVDGQKQTFLNALKIYTKSVFDAINDKDVSLIKFPKYEL